jgi:small-conductance mechanosensitive channel
VSDVTPRHVGADVAFAAIAAMVSAMVSWSASVAEALVLLPIAFGASWLARAAIRSSLRRAVRRAQRAEGSWRIRLDRLGDNGQADARKRQRADAVARMLGHMVTVVIFAVATLASLALLGVSPVVAISSAGFVGFAIAISGQHLANDVIAGTRALLEDRYAAGDEVILRIAGTDVRGTVDLIGSASVRLRTLDGATWHAGHASIESVTNLSQLPAVSDIEIPIDAWEQADQRDAIDRLASASNDVGLTGVVFLRDIETHEPDGADSDTITVRVKSNRPLTVPEEDIVRAKLLDS